MVFGRAIRHTLLTSPDAAMPQRWSVVVAGHFTGTLRTALNPVVAKGVRVPVSPSPCYRPIISTPPRLPVARGSPYLRCLEFAHLPEVDNILAC